MYTIARYTLLSKHYAHSMDEISSMTLALYRVVMINKQYVHEVYTGRERLIRSHSSARFLLRIKWKFELTYAL